MEDVFEIRKLERLNHLIWRICTPLMITLARMYFE